VSVCLYYVSLYIVALGIHLESDVETPPGVETPPRPVSPKTLTKSVTWASSVASADSSDQLRGEMKEAAQENLE